MTAQPASPDAEFNGGPVDAPLVVLVHGLGSSWAAFEPILPLLTEHVRVLALDFPGFGARAPETGLAPGVAGYADWLERDLARRGVVAAHLVGSSMGGAVALELARRGIAASATAFAPAGFWRTPGRIWCQCLLTVLRSLANRIGGPASAAMTSSFGRALLLFPLHARPRRVTPAAAQHGICALAGAASFTAARDSFTTLRPAVVPARVPISIVWGTRDLVLPAWSQARRARALMPAARHVHIRHAGHLPFWDDPEACADEILSQVRRETDRSRPSASTQTHPNDQPSQPSQPQQTGAAA